METNTARISFRDFFQTHINSWDRSLTSQALAVSYAAAVSPDPAGPFPHIRFPLPGSPEADRATLVGRFESGMGGWSEKIAVYRAKGHALKGRTIEHGGAGEYEWIRNGAKYVSELMLSMGVSNTLAIHSGGQDNELGRRLATEMLPAVSRTLQGEL